MSLFRKSLFVLAGLMTFSSQAALAEIPTPPDPFQWMEEVEGARPLAWVNNRNAMTMEALQGDRRYAGFEKSALAIVGSADKLTFGSYSDGMVRNFWQDAKHVRGLWRQAPLAGWSKGKPQWETILDFDALARDEKQNWVFKGSNCLDPSAKMGRCLISLSNGGKDAVVQREFGVGQNEWVNGGFVIPEAKSDVTWKDENTVLIATDWGTGTLTESGYPFVVKELKRGQKLENAREIYRGKPEDVATGTFRIDDGTRYHHFISRAPTFFTSETSWLKDDGTIVALPLPARHSIQGMVGGDLLVVIQDPWTPKAGGPRYATGSVLTVPLEALASGKDFSVSLVWAPGDREAYQEVGIAKDGVVYVAISKNVKGSVLRCERKGSAWDCSPIALPDNGTVGIADSGVRESKVFFSFQDMLTPSSILMLDGGEKPKAVQTLKPKFASADLVTEQFEAVSKDGTRIPYFIVHRKGIKLDGSTPTLLYGYGGFEVSMLPTYSALRGKLWLEQGGAFVLANIRGGGEFGPDWHQAGLKTRRQVIYDDFIAVAENLIERKITSPRRLGIQGGSNGGLLMGVMLNQRPDLFRAVVVQVPLLDMLRYPKLPAGASWVDEYGSPDIPAERAWLDIMSPYQNLKPRKDFPTPLFITSTKDDRVHPGHARKFAAKMESFAMPFYYYENTDGGHAASANLVESAKQNALVFTYLNRMLVD